MRAASNAVTSPIPVASPQPFSRRRELPAHSMTSAHVMAALKQGGFHLSISGPVPELVARDEKTRIALDALTLPQLEAIKHMAHDQYVRAMLNGDMELDTHRATLNFLSRHLTKAAPVPATRRPVGAGSRKAARRPSRRELPPRQAA